MEKSLLVISILLVAVIFAGCSKADKGNDSEVVDTSIYGVPETGTMIDITERNTLVATTTPGDVLYLKLLGESSSGKQWTVSAPTSGNSIMLQDHQITGLGDEAGQEFTDEWWLKVEEIGEFSLQFDYGELGQEVEDTFELKIISQSL